MKSRGAVKSRLSGNDVDVEGGKGVNETVARDGGGERFHNTWKQVAFSRVIASTDSANGRSLCTKRRELRWRGNAMFSIENDVIILKGAVYISFA